MRKHGSVDGHNSPVFAKRYKARQTKSKLAKIARKKNRKK